MEWRAASAIDRDRDFHLIVNNALAAMQTYPPTQPTQFLPRTPSDPLHRRSFDDAASLMSLALPQEGATASVRHVFRRLKQTIHDYPVIYPCGAMQIRAPPSCAHAAVTPRMHQCGKRS